MTLTAKMTKITYTQWEKLVDSFGEDLKRAVPFASYTAARLGGVADGVITVNSESHLEKTALVLWDLNVPFLVLGAGSNILVSDAGVREIIILNRAKRVDINEPELKLWAESGVGFGALARKISARGFSGLEWAAGIPGTVGGAVYGNAGAHGWEAADVLIMAKILHPKEGKQQWDSSRMGFDYRSSVLKREKEKSIVLSACFKFERSTVADTRRLMEEFSSKRKMTQPPGASMGSMFKNPPGEFAGRLIEAAGLKGAQIGKAMISPRHANFFINQGGSQAADVLSLIKLAQQKVFDQFGIKLELEIELIGDWEENHA